MGLKLITAPAVEPVTLVDAKAHLRVEGTDDDAYVTNLIQAAREWVETLTFRALITQTWELVLDHFPHGGGQVFVPISSAESIVVDAFDDAIFVPKPPLQSVSSVKYVDTAGVLQTLPASDYQVDAVDSPGRIVPAFGKSWPATRDELNAMTIQFIAGYGAAASAVPISIRQALMIMVSHWYEHREPIVVGAAIASVPESARAMLSDYRVLSMAIAGSIH